MRNLILLISMLVFGCSSIAFANALSETLLKDGPGFWLVFAIPLVFVSFVGFYGSCCELMK